MAELQERPAERRRSLPSDPAATLNQIRNKPSIAFRNAPASVPGRFVIQRSKKFRELFRLQSRPRPLPHFLNLACQPAFSKVRGSYPAFVID
jgi:hypothetical protein